jgi:biotin carboxyl carrier protein
VTPALRLVGISLLFALVADGALGQASPQPAQAPSAQGAIAPAAPAAPERPAAPAKSNGLEVAALIVAGEETTLSSQMAGKIRQVRVGLGDKVK